MAAARRPLEAVLDALDDIREVSETGIRTLMEADRWGGAAFHAAGWNPRHIEGAEHFLFYALERRTGRHFIHGQPVGLGIVAAAILQEHDPAGVAGALVRAGVDVRPAAMGVTWADVEAAWRGLGSFVREAGLWFSVADTVAVEDRHVAALRETLAEAYRDWPAEAPA